MMHWQYLPAAAIAWPSAGPAFCTPGVETTTGSAPKGLRKTLWLLSSYQPPDLHWSDSQPRSPLRWADWEEGVTAWLF
jgi:hypothetical protein